MTLPTTGLMITSARFSFVGVTLSLPTARNSMSPKLNGKAAERQFGYNNDFTQFLPLPWGEKSSDHGLMVVQATKPAILANCRPLSLHVLK
ncbi:hypothetical protein FHT78_001012 [Rhizobium sp. BK196]|uniref:hypothetical protein n=1 Tax=Rhizobium sp. BK196 TaxID=2587073 RepID=UPI0017AF5364|nr:hypothetical protein [Rhizobium sp. BK196]MBB3309283.1 hypothetical protein [Rhizobium sp. BK196]